MDKREEQIQAGARRLVALIHTNMTIPGLPFQLNRMVAERGAPVAVEELAAAGGWSVQEVHEELDREFWQGMERDERGRLTGFGMTLHATPHAFTFERRTVYAWCATDALQFPNVLGRPGVVVSTCPATGKRIRVALSPTEVLDLDPAAAVVSMVRPAEPVSDGRAEVCALGNFFSSRTAAAEWLAAYPDGELVPVADEFEIVRRAQKDLGWMAPTTAGPGGGR